MVGSNKILTVSYGTFSCTLEGFDDSFGTMKAIAEYFRDLASEDRYFGATPPTPDAEMLARIAEREISRRVDARMVADGGLVLRAADPLPQVAPAMMAPAPAPQGPAMATSPAAIVAVQTAPAPQPVPAPVAAPQPVAKAAPETVAAPASAPLAAVRDAPLNLQNDDMPKVPVPAPDMSHPDTAAIRLGSVDDSPDPLLAAAMAAVDPISEPVRPLLVRPAAVRVTPRPVVLPPSAMPVATERAASSALPAHPDSESIAAKLQRIRAVVGQAPAVLDTQQDDDLFDPAMDHYDPAPPRPDEEIAGLTSDDSDLGSLFGALGLDSAVAETAVSEAAGDDVPAPAEDRLAESSEDGFTAGDDSTDILSETRADLTPVDVAPVPAEPVATPIRARVIRMRRADFDRAVSEGRLDQALPTANASANAPAAAQVAALSAADEADLLAELAAVEQDVGATTLPDSSATAGTDDHSDLLAAMQQPEMMGIDALLDPEPPTARPTDAQSAAAASDDADEFGLSAYLADEPGLAAAAHAEPVGPATMEDETADGMDQPRAGADLLRAHADGDEAALDRILSQTEAKMNEPDALHRRAAIAQMKAAVVATEAARALGDEDPLDLQDTENAFRDDLRQVARPRRPMLQADQRTERPRPAPLKLVPAQRVDLPPTKAPAAAVAAVRPRRIAAPEPQVPVAAAGFAAFAADAGATNLADLLEAAAAYTSFVEGSEDFSRPQLMTKLSQVSEEPWSREDTLRSFGTLLREGRITRSATAGRFQVNGETRFHPERLAG